MKQGLRIKITRLEKGFNSASKFAKKAGISRECLSGLENERTHNPTRAVMIKISKTLGVDIKELFFPD